MKNNAKWYKVYHRNYRNIMELYDDLSDAILDIELENKRIKIRYNSDTFEIEPCPGGYYTYLNGKRENGPSKYCVAERDITKRYIRFYTPHVSTKFVFSDLFVFKKGNRFLVGGREKRFRALQQAIAESGYTTYDLS